MSQFQFNSFADLLLDLRRTGVNARTDVPAGTYASVVHQAKGGLVHTQITLLGDTTFTLGATGARAGGVKLLQFANPMGMIIVGAAGTGTFVLTAATATLTAGEVGLGTVVASGNVAVLGGTATFENIAEGAMSLGAAAPLANVAAGATGSFRFNGGARPPVGDFGTTPTANAVFLNMASTVGVATSNVTFKAGCIFDIWHIPLPPTSPTT